MALLAHGLPPAADRLDGESGGVMICADTHPALVVVDVVDAIGNGTAKLRVYEVVDVDELRASLTTPFLAGILEIAHQLLLLRVDRDHRLVGFQEGGRLVCDVLELRVAVDVLLPFLGLAVRLQTIAQIVQKLAHQRTRHLVPLPGQLLHEIAQAACRPQKRRHRVASRRGRDQSLQVLLQRRILVDLALASGTKAGAPAPKARSAPNECPRSLARSWTAQAR